MVSGDSVGGGAIFEPGLLPTNTNTATTKNGLLLLLLLLLLQVTVREEVLAKAGSHAEIGRTFRGLPYLTGAGGGDTTARSRSNSRPGT